MRTIKIPADISQPLEELDVPTSYPEINEAMFDKGVYIEEVHPKGLEGLPDTVLLVDEDGLSKRLPLNERASFIYGTHVHRSPIVGDAYVVSLNARRDDWASLSKIYGVGQIQAAIELAAATPRKFL